MKRIFALFLICALLCSCLAFASCTGDLLTPPDTNGDGSGNADGHQHTDANEDEICDSCKESVIVIVDFYAVNDLHGKFCDTNTQPGVDELSTYLKNAKKTDEHVVLLSAGDIWQGSAESNLTDGILMTEWMNFSSR